MNSKGTKTSIIGINLLDYIRPFTSVVPQVATPKRPRSFQEKIVWTILAIVIYLVASQVSLFGLSIENGTDPLSWMRLMMASNRGTLMDLGISPVVTGSMIMQSILSLRIITPNYSIKEDKALVDVMQKLISILVTIGQGLVQLGSGYYGPVEKLGVCSCIMILSQVLISGVLIVLLDEMLQKGYGFGNGVNLFIVTNVCENIIWSGFSPRAFYTGRGLEFEGCIISFLHTIIAKPNKISALASLFTRTHLPNLTSFLSTILILGVVVYAQSIRIEIPIVSRKHKGLTSSYPIKLLYMSTMPIIIQSYTISHFTTVSRLLFMYFPNNILVRILGVWGSRPSGVYGPISGIAYYIYPPGSFTDVIRRPIFFVVYLVSMLFSAALISREWMDIQEDNGEMAGRKIKNMDMQIKGMRDVTAVEVLDRYLTTSAWLGGIFTSFVVIFCDVASTLGSGSNIFLAASIINQYMKFLGKESAKRQGMQVID